MEETGPPFEWGDMPDLTAFSEEDVKSWLHDFSEEEREISYRRRVLQGRIDLLRAELVRRGGFSISADELALALMGDSSVESPDERQDALWEDPRYRGDGGVG